MRAGPRDKETSARLISRRALLIGGVQAAAVAGLGARLAHLQGAEAEHFRLLAEENRISIRLIPPSRGLIHDRRGVLIAGNEPVYRVVITRDDAGDVAGVLRSLAQIIPLQEDEIERTLRAAARSCRSW